MFNFLNNFENLTRDSIDSINSSQATSDWRENTNGPINHGPTRISRYLLNNNQFKNGFLPWRRMPLHTPGRLEGL